MKMYVFPHNELETETNRTFACSYIRLSRVNCHHIPKLTDYKDVYRETVENQHHTFILKANYVFSICIVNFKLALSTE